MKDLASEQNLKLQKRFCWASLIVSAIASTCILTKSDRASAQIFKNLPLFQDLNVSPNFAPDSRTMRGISGGEVSISDVVETRETTTGPCVGFADEQPDHTLVLDSFFSYLRIEVQSPKDTTIAVEGPGGIWCNDDYRGKNPGFGGQWLPGTYKIWVGSYKPNDYNPYTIRLTENP
jgi:hypothetical protein